MIRTTRVGAVVLVFGAMLLAVLAPAAASGASRNWVGGTGGSWYLDTNWDPAGYPDPSDFLTVASGSADSGMNAILVHSGGSITVLYSGVSVTTPQLFIAYWGAGTLNVEYGAQFSVVGGAVICGSLGTTGTVNVTGSASLLTHSLTIGARGVGTLNLSGHGDATSSGAIYLGTDPSATGIISMTGYGTSLEVGDYLNVGYTGTGTLEVFSGAQASCQNLIVAYYAGSVGTVNVDGAYAYLNGGMWLLVGNEGYGGLIVQNGGTVTADYCYLGVTGLGRGDARVEGLGSLLAADGLEVGGTDFNTATLDILDHGQVHVDGTTTVRAMGVIDLAGGKLVTGTLAGAGRLNFSSGTLQVTAGGLTFGYGQPIGPSVTLNTGDLIDISGDAALDYGAAVLVAGGKLQANAVANYGTLDVRFGGTVAAANQVNASTVYLDGGTISAPSGLTNDYGALLVARGTITGPLTNFGQTCVTGTLSVSGTVTSFGSVVATNLPDTPILRCGSLDNYGLIDLAARYWTEQQWVTVPGTVTTVMPTAAVTNYAGAVIRGCSSIGGRLTNEGGLIYANLPGTLLIRELTSNTLGGELRVADGATMSILTAFANDGEINLEGPNAALAGGAIANTGTLHGQGRVSNPLTNSGSVRVDAGILRLTGSLTSGPGALIEVMEGATAFLTQGLAINQGDIVLRDATFDNNSRTMANNGTITGCGTLRTGSLTNSVGHGIGVGGGDLDIIGPVHTDGPVTTEGGCTTTFYGFVNGTGSFFGEGTVVFLAGYSPGDSPANVSFGGNVVLGSTGRLVAELGGTAPGAQYDQVNVANAATLGGTLEVNLINGFRPAHNDTFQVMTFGSRAGTFASATGLDLGSRLTLEPAYSSTDLALVAVQGGSGAWRFDASDLASRPTNWTGGIPNGVGDTATFGPVIQAPRKVTVDAATVLMAMVFDSAKAYTVAGPGTVTLNAGGDLATIFVTGASGAAHHVISAPVTLLSPLDINNQSSGDLTFAAALNDAAGRPITKNGDGSVTFEGPLTFGAGSLLMVYDGTVNLDSDAGSDVAANLSIDVMDATVNFGHDQHLDWLTIGPDGKVAFTGARVVVLNHLVLDGLDLGGMVVTPEPATLSLLALGGLLALRRRR